MGKTLNYCIKTSDIYRRTYEEIEKLSAISKAESFKTTISAKIKGEVKKHKIFHELEVEDLKFQLDTELRYRQELEGKIKLYRIEYDKKLRKNNDEHEEKSKKMYNTMVNEHAMMKEQEEKIKKFERKKKKS